MGGQSGAVMMASRARRRIQHEGLVSGDSGPPRQRAIVRTFLAASRDGDFDTLLRLPDPDVTFRTDLPASRAGAPADLYRAVPVARQFFSQA
jgi:RNA polymerase sigma-70 factor (ECF subfamily)